MIPILSPIHTFHTTMTVYLRFVQSAVHTERINMQMNSSRVEFFESSRIQK